MELPRSLFCLNLAYNIDNRDIVEQLLLDFPEETEQCIPIALRSILAVDYLPAVPFFSSRELIEYLSLLWNDQPLNNKLYNAAGDGLIYLVAYYLDRGACIHAYGDRPLMLSSTYSHVETTRLLLDRKANIHAARDSALMSAAKYGNNDIIKLLVERKADIHAGSDEALRYAKYYGHTETVKLLAELSDKSSD